METSIKLECEPTLQNHGACEFTGHMLAADPSWAVYRREDGMTVLYDKILRAVYIVDNIHKLDSYLDEFARRHTEQTLSTMPGDGDGTGPPP